jgi:chemotaxis protein MotB
VSDSVKEALSKGGITAAVREVLGGTVNEKGQGNAMMKGPGGTQRASRGDDQPEVVEFLPSLNYLTEELSTEIKEGKIQVRLTPRGLVVSLQEATFFPSGEDTVSPGTYSSLEKIARVLKELHNPVRLEGHTDSVPIHNSRFRSNWELSAARGIAMLNLFADKFEIPRARMAVTGYADTMPADTNDTPEGRARNRRVDVTILSQRAMSLEGAVAEAAAGQRQGGEASPEPRGKSGAH